MSAVQLDRLSAAYGETEVLRGIRLEIADGELLALLGPSGCGKTTLLKIIAGLLEPTAGDVRFGAESILRVAAERRDAAMVFQKPLLFPYLTVQQNVAFGLKMRGVAGEEAAQRVREALVQVQLDSFEKRKPNELSGGQEQRVALARALVTRPRVLLLDEPFSALDEILRGEMRALLRGLQRQMRITTVFVTHDQLEAAALADRIALMFDGRVEQVGAPRDFYLAPRTARVARFFGWRVLTGVMARDEQGAIFKTALGAFRIGDDCGKVQVAATRPEAIQLRPATQTTDTCKGHIMSVVDLGIAARYGVMTEAGERLEIEQTGTTPFAMGDTVEIVVNAAGIRFFEQP